jgi:hypothetical protein
VFDRAAGEALLAKLDEFAGELARFRAELIALMPPPATDGAGSEGADDFAEQHLIDPASAFVTGSIQNNSADRRDLPQVRW